MVIWMLYGVVQSRRQASIRVNLMRTSRTKRMFFGIGGFILSAVVLLGGLFWVGANGGLTQTGLTLWSWFVVAGLGLIFVHLQVLAAASMITLVQENETMGPGRPSDSGSSSEEKGQDE